MKKRLTREECMDLLDKTIEKMNAPAELFTEEYRELEWKIYNTTEDLTDMLAKSIVFDGKVPMLPQQSLVMVANRLADSIFSFILRKVDDEAKRVFGEGYKTQTADESYILDLIEKMGLSKDSINKADNDVDDKESTVNPEEDITLN